MKSVKAAGLPVIWMSMIFITINCLCGTAKAELVGAYRLGMVDKLIADHGLDQLYSRSLFNYNQEFIDTLDNSIELSCPSE